jgi:predicted GNAT family acetyltransferase
MLMKKEACNNLMLGILKRLQDGQSIYDEVYTGYVEKDGEVIFAFMQTPPNNWIFPEIEGVSEEVPKEIAKFLWANKLEVPGILGPNHLVKPFVNEWEKLNDVTSHIHMNQLIYQLDNVVNVPKAEGELVEADKSDQQLITDWLVQFGREVNEPTFAKDASKLAERFFTNRSIYVWIVDGVPVSMVNQSRKTKNGASVNAVFTPDEHKRNGYATCAVAALSTKLLEEGAEFCSLYTDADFPTSNRIYKKIGYYEVGDSIVYEFK